MQTYDEMHFLIGSLVTLHGVLEAGTSPAECGNGAYFDNQCQCPDVLQEPTFSSKGLCSM